MPSDKIFYQKWNKKIKKNNVYVVLKININSKIENLEIDTSNITIKK
jgi:hypothetical protein